MNESALTVKDNLKNSRETAPQYNESVEKTFNVSSLLGNNYGTQTHSVAWGDMDGDGDLDILVGNYGGLDSSKPNKLYRNDGGDVFTDVTTGDLAGDSDDTNSVAWGDMDGDGDLDILVGNSAWDSGQPNKLYRNDGEGIFTNVTPDNLAADSDKTRSVAWGDMDGDGDLDILVGNYGLNKLYRNDGEGIFTDVTIGALAGDSDDTNSVAWGDMDGDGDLDILVGNGRFASDQPNKLYRNDGEGIFTDVTTGDLAGDSNDTNSVAWGDMDGDGDLDILVGNSGRNKLYQNDGEGIFTNVTTGDLAMDFKTTDSVAWGDMDGDSDLDILVGNYQQPNKLYRNDGEGVFIDVTAGDLAVDSDDTRSVAWGDMDGDNDLDILVGNTKQQNKLYQNDKSSVFTDVTTDDLGADSYDSNSVAWGDMDGDGDLDVLVGNYLHDGGQPNKLYRNDGDGAFTDVTVGNLAGDSDKTHSVAWGDMDGDNDLDILVGNGDQPNKLYRNDGEGVFTDVTADGLATDSDDTRSVAWGDMDGDGDLDILVGNGYIEGQPNKVYRNNGEGVFTDVTAGDLAMNSDVTYSVAWGDMDGDGDLDILVGNGYIEGQPNKLYRNDGEGVFTDVTAGDLAVDSDVSSSVAWGDMDGDGDLDILVGNFQQPNKLYRNDGEGGFINVTADDLALDSDDTNSVAWGDMDGDGDLDILVGNFQQPNKLYRNDGEGIFTDVTVGDLAIDSDLPSSETWPDLTRSVAWGDMDGDGDLDILVGSYGHNKLYRNSYRSLANSETSSQFSIVDIMPPESTVKASAYGVAEIVSSQVISVPVIVHNTGTSPINTVKLAYSTTGGGEWFPALSADGEDTIQVVSGTHIFLWDTFASGFFGQSDNVVLRATAFQQTPNGIPGTFNYRHETTGSFLYGASSSASTPFRVRGTQVRVVDEALAVGRGDAIVFHNASGDASFAPIGNGNPFRTNALGFLEGRGELGFGDQIVALLPITSTSTYTLYHVSETIGELGFADPYAVTSGGVQTLTVASENPLLIFDLNVSIEWDARDDQLFLAELEDALKRASEIVYDLTNGQTALGNITVYHEREQWTHADLVIHASNNIRPSAIAGGIAITSTDDVDIDGNIINNAYAPGQIRMGPVWNRFGDTTTDVLGEDWSRTLAHELGHYLFYLPDNYLGIDPVSGLLTFTECDGSVMSDPYTEGSSEFLTQDADKWQEGCRNTLADVYMGRGDWETIRTFYPMLTDTVNTGPNRLSLNLTQVQFIEPITPTSTIENPYFNLIDEDSNVYPVSNGRAEAFVFKTYNDEDVTNDYVQPLGSPINDTVYARGIEIGDRLCVYDYGQEQLHIGCINEVGAFPTAIMMRPVPEWEPAITVTEVNSQTFAITVTNLTSESDLMVQLLPTFGSSSEKILMHRAGADTFTQTITLPNPVFAGYVRVWTIETDESSSKESTVDFISIEDWNAHSINWGAPSTSSDGQVIIFPLDNPFADTTTYTMQKLTFLPTIPSWLTPVGQPYHIRTTNSAMSNIGLNGSILFRYLGRDVDRSYENNISVYFSEDGGVTWERVDTEVDEVRNHAVAKASEQGTYLLAVTQPTTLRTSLQEGWNNVPFPVEVTRPITEALASIEGSFTSVYWHDDTENDRWLLYDSTVVAPFEPSVNTLDEMTLDAYWIYATDPITWYVGIETSKQRNGRKVATISSPPATYYGWVTSDDEIPLGSVVEARIDGTVCGQTTIVEIENEPAYVMQIKAESVIEPNGCGMGGREVAFIVNDTVITTTNWNNNQAHFHSLVVPLVASATPTVTNTPTMVATHTPTRTNISVPVATNTPVLLPTETISPTTTPSTLQDQLTNTPVPMVTNTPISSPTLIPTPRPTNTPVLLPTATSTPVPMVTNTPISSPILTPTSRPTNIPVPLPTAMSTNMPSITSTLQPINTPVPVVTNTPTPIPVMNTPQSNETAVPVPTNTVVSPIITAVPVATSTSTSIPVMNTPQSSETAVPVPTNMAVSPAITATVPLTPTVDNAQLMVGMINGIVFGDSNENGRYEPNLGDLGLDGILITLQSEMGVMWVTETISNGIYQFDNLPRGQLYTIHVGTTRLQDHNISSEATVGMDSGGGIAAVVTLSAPSDLSTEVIIPSLTITESFGFVPYKPTATTLTHHAVVRATNTVHTGFVLMMSVCCIRWILRKKQ